MKQVKRMGVVLVAASLLSFCFAMPSKGPSGNIVASPQTSTAK